MRAIHAKRGSCTNLRRHAHDAKSFSDNGTMTIVVEMKRAKKIYKIDKILMMQILQCGSQHHFFPHVVIIGAFKSLWWKCFQTMRM
jgi:hypothetical protein